jgi:hypothetical protein
MKGQDWHGVKEKSFWSFGALSGNEIEVVQSVEQPGGSHLLI